MSTEVALGCGDTAKYTGPNRDRRDRFAQAIVSGYSRTQAALLAGTPARSAGKVGMRLWADEYVQERIKFLRDALHEDDIVQRKDILIGLLAEARDTECANGTQAARVSAWNSIARIIGVEKPQRLDINIGGGVMLVPMSAEASDWEALAYEQQQALRDAVRS